MKMRLVMAGLLLTLGTGMPRDVAACGEKFLNGARGTRYDRPPAARQAAAILLYASPGSALTHTLTALSVEATLRKAGYRPTIVATQLDLDEAVRTRQWDLVVVDAADSQSISQRLSGPTAPSIVPVLHNPSTAQLKEARDRYRNVVKTPRKGTAFTETIDDAMARREAMARTGRKSTD